MGKMNVVRNVVYMLGFRPRRGSFLYSPSKHVLFGARRMAKRGRKVWNKR